MIVHQFVHALNYGDAISGEAITIKRLLSEQGIENYVYCLHEHPKVQEHATKWHLFEKHFEEAKAKNQEQRLLLHYSIASPLNDIFSKTTGVLKALLYHNLTPVKWFAPYNARVAEDLEVGFSELPILLEEADVVLADSTYNKSQLEELGCESCQVLPLPIDSSKWSISANAGIESILSSNGCKNFLHVGRLAPNKCIEDILKAFYFYHHKIDENSRLWLIGHDVDTEIYSLELSLLCKTLRIEHAVSFVGSVADTELKAFYQNCDAYICMSEHEGFCVPVIEAMSFALPVIAYSCTALPETIGEGGLLIESKDPAKTAELMQLLVSDLESRKSLVSAGLSRSKDFSTEAFSDLFRKLFLEGKPAEKKEAVGA